MDVPRGSVVNPQSKGQDNFLGGPICIEDAVTSASQIIRGGTSQLTSLPRFRSSMAVDPGMALKEHA
jgi:hypothetical protein